MSWQTPSHTFKCGPCGTTVTGLFSLKSLHAVMDKHAETCPGFPPNVEPHARTGSAAAGTETT